MTLKHAVEAIKTSGVTCLLVMSLVGPSLITLACEWTCASHDRAMATTDDSDCHGHHPEGDGPLVAASGVCHDLLSSEVILRPAPPPFDLEPAIAQSPVFVLFEPSRATPVELAQLGPPATSRITPPLRI